MSTAEGDQIRVLHVDDEQALGDTVALHLERQRETFSVVTETSADDAIDRLADGEVDCIVSDHDMPRKNGLEFLREVRETCPEFPFILFTGKGNEEIASEAISAGVTEYLQKGTGTEQYAVLANRIEQAVSAYRTKDALEESERRHSTLISNLPGMVYRCRNEREWPMTFVSDGAVDLTGYEAAAIESGDVNWAEEVIHDEDQQEMWELVQAAIAAEEPFEVTYRIETAEGDVRWMWERGRVVDSEDGSEILEGFVTDITARRDRERELQAEREFTENILNSMEDAFFVFGEDGNLIRWNDSVVEVTEFTDERVSSMEATEFFVEADRRAVDAAGKRALQGEEVRLEAKVKTADGEAIPYEFRQRALYDVDGDLVGVGGLGRDISERKARERELEQYRTLVESVGDPMYVTDADRTIIMTNVAMAAHLGYTREEIVGESVEKFTDQAAIERADELIEQLLADDGPRWATFQMQSITADGSRRDVEDMISVLTDEDGNFDGSVGVIRDISDHKQRERGLERYETIIQAVGDPVYTLDEDGVFTFVNDAMESLSGYDHGSLIGSHISKVMTGEDVSSGNETIRELLKDDGVANATLEMDVITADGRSIPVENHIALLPLEDGEFRGTAGVVRDVTEQKEREQRLEEFASVVSHDLRNPLNVVQGRIQLALESGSVENLDAALDAAKRMERLTDDLLRLARQGRDRDNVEPVAIANVARDAWDHVVTDGASLTIETDRTVEADPERVTELFENFFRNAVQHGQDDNLEGPLSIRVGDTDDGLVVEDDGVGIDPDHHEDVFERGYTTSNDGTGFGLAIVESIASAHDWDVEVADAEDAEGARFEITC